MSFQQRTIGEICSELVAEAIRMGYSKRYVWGHMSKYLSIIRGYYRNHHICIFSVEDTDACLASYRIRYAQGTVTRVFFMHLSTTVRRLEEYALTGELSIITHNKRTPEPLPPYFESVLDRFIHHANYKENTVNDADWVVRKYLRFFSSEGHASLADVSMEDVRSFIMKTAMEVKNSTLHDIFLCAHNQAQLSKRQCDYAHVGGHYGWRREKHVRPSEIWTPAHSRFGSLPLA